LKELSQAHLSSPVSRIRRGILRGPQLEDPGNVKDPSLIAVGIDGSVTLIQPGGSIRPVLFDRVKKILSGYSPVCRLLLESISHPLSMALTLGSQPSRADNLVMDVDTVAYLVRRTSLGTWTSFLSRADVLSGMDRREKLAIREIMRYLSDKKDIEGLLRNSI
jgi:hypothetical protein